MKNMLLLLLVFLSLTYGAPAAWQKNIVIHNSEFEKFRVIVQNNDTLSIIGCLKSDKVIDESINPRRCLSQKESIDVR